MRIKIFCSALLILMLNVALLHAQVCTGPGCPCGGTDDDGSCVPLDSWIVILAAAALLFTVKYLYGKQKNIYTGKHN
jgi:hypothetical protein